MFMGDEFGQTSEWNYERELDWELLQHSAHNDLQECVRTLNYLYRTEPAMYENQFEKKGFEWVNTENRKEGILVFKRKGKHRNNDLLVVLNMTVHPRKDWTEQVKGKAHWHEIFNSDDVKLFNSDDVKYWGSGKYMNQNIICAPVDKKKKLYEIKLTIPPLAAIILR